MEEITWTYYVNRLMQSGRDFVSRALVLFVNLWKQIELDKMLDIYVTTKSIAKS